MSLALIFALGWLCGAFSVLLLGIYRRRRANRPIDQERLKRDAALVAEALIEKGFK